MVMSEFGGSVEILARLLSFLEGNLQLGIFSEKMIA